VIFRFVIKSNLDKIFVNFADQLEFILGIEVSLNSENTLYKSKERHAKRETYPVIVNV